MSDIPSASSASQPTPPSRISRQIERAEIVKSTPPRVRIYSQRFDKYANGCVEMKLVDIVHPQRVRREVINQSLTLPPIAWSYPDVWDRIARRILRLATSIEAPAPQQKKGKR